MFFSQISSSDFLEPIVFVRRENTIGLTVLRQDFTALKHHIVFEADEGHALVGKYTFGCRIPRQCIRFIIMVGEDGLNAEFGDQLLQTRKWFSMAHQKPGLFFA